MLRRSVATAFVLLVALRSLTGGCGTSPSVEQDVPGTERVVLQIGGMTCGGCALAVRQALTNLDGVVAAEVSFGEARAGVRFRSDLVAPDDMVQAIEACPRDRRPIEPTDLSFRDYAAMTLLLASHADRLSAVTGRVSAVLVVSCRPTIPRFRLCSADRPRDAHGATGLT